MATYTAQIATALRLCAAKGQSATLRKVTPGAPADATKPWLPGAATNANTTITAVVLPASEGLRSLGYSNIAETGLTQEQARFLLVPASGLAVDIFPQDKIIGVEGAAVQWEVVASDLLAPNGEKILWQLLIKRLGVG